MKKQQLLSKEYLIESIIALLLLLTALLGGFTGKNIIATKAESANAEISYEEITENGEVVGYRIGAVQGIIDETLDLVIEPINGLPVLEIDTFAFTGSKLNSITIADSNSPINIKSSAFNGCEVNCIRINESATFYDENSIDIDATGQSISESVFATCTAETIILPSNLEVIGMDMFNDCENLSVLKTNTGNDNVLPDTLTRIHDRSFKKCYSLPALTHT